MEKVRAKAAATGIRDKRNIGRLRKEEFQG
jgi:hypothetical protein